MFRSLSSFHMARTHFFQKQKAPSFSIKNTLLGLTKGYSSTAYPINTRALTMPTMRLPIGYDNFRELIEKKADFVDKSLFIKEVIDDFSQAIVLTRPRRFGKTLNLSMLHHFLASEAYGCSTNGLFNQLKIAQLDTDYMQYQGQYPVIFVTFKGIKATSFQKAYAGFRKLMHDLYSEHEEILLSSTRLSAIDKASIHRILEKTADETEVADAIADLTRYLFRHYKVKPWILIDEYDTPLQSAYVHGYYEEMIVMMRSVFASALKTNPYLNRAVITGILRIAKESLFSGVNNLEVYSLLRSEYGQYFGFTEEEVDDLIQKAQLTIPADDIKTWYNGYQMGDKIVYNPWSVVNCIKRKGVLEPYWVNTSDNELIRDLLIKSSGAFKANFESLLQDIPIEHIIDENTVFGYLEENESALWSLLLMAGYLKPVSQTLTDRGRQCSLAIPNKEVKNLYRQLIEQWLSNGHGLEWYDQFLNNLLSGNIDAFRRDLTDIMERIISVRDTSRDPEAFYHGLVMGLTVSLSYHKNYDIQSNRESGYGFYDYMIFSKDTQKPTIILEFKKVDAHKDSDTLQRHLESAAVNGLAQIARQHYLAEAEKRGATNILKLSIAFCGKRFHLEHEHTGATVSLSRSTNHW